MRRDEQLFALPQVVRVGSHLAGLVKTARLARGWSQVELAERARISAPTMTRLEKGVVSASLGTWLSVFDALGLLRLFERLEDRASDALLDETRAKRPVRSSTRDDLDF
ncbi:helix-turn-helix domain-containing protein [Xanthomonas sp. NCPPB 2632]|jgi:transcriptional regulator with XRE-family HTH domain|uniref:helix-turn-helix domain-containing protein n=1 Tax=Xanthomonas sp. NCPPB 2632 TaxID=3240912 RepID=UPI003510F1AB